MKITVLGSGASSGVPAAGNFWGNCDPENKKNHRMRASILIESGITTLLVDMTPDVRHQLKVQHLDGILLSHAHADHIHGMDDLRVLSYHMEKTLDLYGNQATIDELEKRFSYVFKGSSNGAYMPFMKPHIIEPYTRVTFGDIDIELFEQDHTTCQTLGFRIGDFAYSVDVAHLDERALEALSGVKTWIVDAAKYHQPTTLHANIEQVKGWVGLIQPDITYLTVLTSFMDYNTLCDELPKNIRPAYDGLTLEV